MCAACALVRERHKERDGTPDDKPDRWYVWGEGTVFRRPADKGMLVNGLAGPAMKRLFARIAAWDPDWAPPPPADPGVEMSWGGTLWWWTAHG